jgi:hypothetical protein
MPIEDGELGVSRIAKARGNISGHVRRLTTRRYLILTRQVENDGQTRKRFRDDR